MISLDWFLEYSELPHEEPDLIIQSWDTASKDHANADKTACTTWHLYGKQIYLINTFTARLKYPDLKKACKRLAAKYDPSVVLI